MGVPSFFKENFGYSQNNSFIYFFYILYMKMIVVANRIQFIFVLKEKEYIFIRLKVKCFHPQGDQRQSWEILSLAA